MKKILVSGASGLIGSALCANLEAKGKQVLRLSRKPVFGDRERWFSWNPENRLLDKEALEDVDIIIHLAGESIAAGRWTNKKKRKIRQSRVAGTRLLVETLRDLKRKPELLICASAIGFYGNRGDVWLDEQSGCGQGFLSDVCKEWESEASAAGALGVRVILLRLGLVLSREGGIFPQLMVFFRAGLGARFGSGHQYISWIGIEDVYGAVEFLIDKQNIKGPVNLTAPTPVSNREFTVALAAAVGRRAWLQVPVCVLHLLLGRQMADEVLLSSTRVSPKVLLGAGYRFRYSTLEAWLQSWHEAGATTLG